MRLCQDGVPSERELLLHDGGLEDRVAKVEGILRKIEARLARLEVPADHRPLSPRNPRPVWLTTGAWSNAELPHRATGGAEPEAAALLGPAVGRRKSSSRKSRSSLASHTGTLASRTETALSSMQATSSMQVVSSREDSEYIADSECSDIVNVDDLVFDTDDSRRFAQSKDAVHTVGESVWEGAVLFVNMGGLTSLDSFYIAFALFANILAQVIFVGIVSSSTFTKDPFPSVESLQHWRYSAGHKVENVDHSSWSSMTSRVCSGDGSLAMSTHEEAALGAVHNYCEPIFGFALLGKGAVLSIWVVALWCLFVLDEVWLSVSFTRALSKLARAPRTIVRINQAADKDDSMFRLEAISWRRLMLMYVVTAIRVVIAILLMISGTFWLARTKSLVDLILNATALAFTLEIDETLFKTLTPLPAKVIVQRLEPLSRNPVMLTPRIDVGPTTNLITVAAVVVATLVYIIVPAQEKMNEMTEALCGGNQDFVSGIVGATGAIFTTPTSPFVGYGAVQTLYQQAIAELVNTPQLDNSTVLEKSWLYMDQEEFRSLLTRKASYFASMNPGCMDAYGEKLSRYLPTIRELTGVVSAESCGDMVGSCTALDQTMLRLVCPATCGCSSPLSGLFPNKPHFGCPESCAVSSGYLAEFDTPCRDTPLADLQRMPGWISYGQQFVQFVVKVEEVGIDAALAIKNDLMHRGCEAVADSHLDSSNGFPIRSLLCSRTSFHATLHVFCPAACNCETFLADSCPRTCGSPTHLAGIEH